HPVPPRQPCRSIAEGGDHSGQLVAGDRRRPVTAEAVDPGRGPRQLIPGESRRMNLNNDIAVVRARQRARVLRLGPLHQLHPGRSRSPIRPHNRLHPSPPSVEVLPLSEPLHPLSLDGLSDRNGSIKILASPASMRNAEWPCHVCFNCLLGNVSLYWKCKVIFPAAYLHFYQNPQILRRRPSQAII